jgi:hypothetical protein
MSLMKQVSEDIQAYKAFVQTIVEKIEKIEDELNQEKRIGIDEVFEAHDYYMQDKGPKQAADDSVDFQNPGAVEKPVQHPGEQRVRAQRMHLIYDPKQGKVIDTVKTGIQSRPPAEYIEANADQVANAMKHIEGMSPEIADRIKKGTISIWIPRSQAQPISLANQASNTGGTNKIEMDPNRLATAQAAANKMSFA